MPDPGDIHDSAAVCCWTSPQRPARSAASSTRPTTSTCPSSQGSALAATAWSAGRMGGFAIGGGTLYVAVDLTVLQAIKGPRLRLAFSPAPPVAAGARPASSARPPGRRTPRGLDSAPGPIRATTPGKRTPRGRSPLRSRCCRPSLRLPGGLLGRSTPSEVDLEAAVTPDGPWAVYIDLRIGQRRDIDATTPADRSPSGRGVCPRVRNATASVAFHGRSVVQGCVLACAPRGRPPAPETGWTYRPAWSGLRPRGHPCPGVVARSDADAVPGHAG